MTISINRRLNLVITVETAERGTAHIYSQPVGREVFEQFYRPMSRVFSTLFKEGIGEVGGPRVAYLMLKEMSEAGGNWPDVERGLIQEIIRLSNIAVMSDKGWEQLPLYVAFERGILTADDRADIVPELLFFTLAQWCLKPNQRLPMMAMVCSLTGSLVTASGFTEYLSSLPTLKLEDNSGETANTASLPR